MEKIVFVQNNIRDKIADIKNNPALKMDASKQTLFSEMCEYFDLLHELTMRYEKENV